MCLREVRLLVVVVACLSQSYNTACITVKIAPTHPCSGGGSGSESSGIGAASSIQTVLELEDSNLTLNDALQNITSNMTLQLEPGTHHIEDFTLLQGIQDISFIGMDGGECDVIITCSPGVGIALLNMSDLLIQNVRIDGCGLNGQNLNSTLDQLESFVQIFYHYPNPDNVSTGLLLGYCSDVTMDNVTITNVRGYGVLGINVIGFSRLTNIHFTDNGVVPGGCHMNQSDSGFSGEISRTVYILRQFLEFSEQFGSGALFLYQDFTESHQPMHNDQQYTLDIDTATFTGNQECSYVYTRYIENDASSYISSLGYRLGGGGGLTLLLAQLGYGVNVTVSSSYFNNNSAFYGGSIFVVVFLGLQNTHVVIDDCNFHKNGAPEDIHMSDFTTLSRTGAGITLINDVLPPQDTEERLAASIFHNRNITMKISNSVFTKNKALYGSGLHVYSTHHSSVNDINDALQLFVENCRFEQNMAFLGSAFTVYELKISGSQLGMQTYITNTDFINNTIQTTIPGGSVAVNQNFGIIDIQGINITFFGDCLFHNNSGTAVRAHSSLLGIVGNVTFQSNIGVNGGALYLVDNTYIIMSPNSSLYLLDNVAQVSGGAFYIDEIGSGNFVSSDGFLPDCFLYFSYNDFFICTDCSDLNRTGVHIEFSNNVAPAGSDVYGSALLSCPWALSLIEENLNMSVLQIVHRDYPNIFKFDRAPEGPSLVRSTAARLIIDNLDDFPDRVVPGEEFNIRLSTFDDYNQIVSTVVRAFAVTSVPQVLLADSKKISAQVSENNYGILRSNEPSEVPFRVTGSENQNVTVIIYSTDTGFRAQASFTLEMSSCNFGFDYDPTELICVCNEVLEERGVSCDLNSNTLVVVDNLWIGPIGDDDIGVRSCIAQYCEPGTRNISVGNNTNHIDFDVQCAQGLYRSGILCGSCMEGYSHVLGGVRCLRCTNYYALLFVVFLLLGIFVIFAIRYLRLTITGGYINGVIFYSNIVSLYGYLFVPNTTFNLVIVALPTLNLGFETCLYNNMSALERVWWQLSFSLYLFILMGLTTLLARSKYLKFREYFSGLSIIQAFATLLVVCYVSVLQVCVELLGFVQIFSVNNQTYHRWITDPSIRYFSGRHAPLAVLAILLFLFYLIPLPLLLLFPPLLYRNRYLSKFKPIYDAFWDPFESQFRFWLGLRLIFRWLPFALVFITRPPINLFITNLMVVLLMFIQMIVQPFRGKWRNVVDSYFLLNLVAMFSGSLFFNAEADRNQGRNRSTAQTAGQYYIQTLMVLGFLAMLAVIAYHIVERFPKLKSCLAKMFIRKKKVKYSSEENSTTSIVNHTSVEVGLEASFTSVFDEDTGKISRSLKSCATNNPTPSKFSAAVLREPLLESGSIEIDTVSPSTVPKRYNQHFTADQ